MVVDVDHPKLGSIKTFNFPVKFFGNEMGIEPGENPLDPAIGEHNDEVCKDILGLSDEQIETLKQDKTLWS